MSGSVSDAKSASTIGHIVRHAIAATSAGVVAALVSSPFITIVDKAITSNASGREPMWTCMANGFKSLFTNPRYFFSQPSFRWIAMVYSGTYISANLVQLACEYKGYNWQYPKFIATSATNITLSALKDMAFAKMFAQVGAAPRPVPMTSLALFAARDSMTIFASFSLPPLIASLIGGDPRTARSIAQMTTPIIMQAFAVPLHLYALDLYNKPGATFSGRVQFVKREYTKTLIARWCRIFPAYSLGGVINLECWDLFKKLAGERPWMKVQEQILPSPADQ